MTSFPKSAESHFFLESINIESFSITLLLISTISRNEARKCIVEVSFTIRICEVEFFQIVDEHIFFYVLNSCDIPAWVLWKNGIVSLCGGMGNHFFAPRPIFGTNGAVMIALDPKNEETFGCDHTIIGLLVVLEFFQISNISSDIAGKNNDEDIDKVGNHNN